MGLLTMCLPSAAAGQAVDSLESPPMEPDSVEATVAYAGPLPPAAADALGYILSSSPDTPGGMGLLATGMAEAEIAAEHVALAGRDSTSLANMQRHMSHVLHAVDPSESGQGPGMGYGVRRAANEILQQARRLEAPGTASDFDSDLGENDVPGVLAYHAPYVAQAARGAALQANRVVDLARQVQRATSAAAAHRLVERLASAVRAMAHGYDADDDGRVGHTEDEMGLAQVRHHLGIVERLTR